MHFSSRIWQYHVHCTWTWCTSALIQVAVLWCCINWIVNLLPYDYDPVIFMDHYFFSHYRYQTELGSTWWSCRFIILSLSNASKNMFYNRWNLLQGWKPCGVAATWLASVHTSTWIDPSVTWTSTSLFPLSPVDPNSPSNSSSGFIGKVFPLLQIIRRFDISRFIAFAMYLDITYI